mgnify:CR=1 FL=1
MFKSILEKMLGSYSDREIKRVIPIVDKIESFEDEMKALSDEQLKYMADAVLESVKEMQEGR